MIRGIRAVTAVLLTLVLLLSMPLTALAEITDIEGHWAKAIIESTAERGVLKGYPDGSFRPDAPMTQAEFFALVNRSFGFQEAAEAVSSSVPENAWYTADYKIAGAQGYLELLAAGLIKPNTPISRQMAGAILGKVLKLDSDETAVKAYGDGSSFASWSKGLCGAVSQYGYMQGYKDGSFRPEANISRAEVAAILYRVLGSLYNTAGVYGSSQSITTVPGNVTITRSGVTLRNMVIEGNLYLTEGIGDGTVTLERVTVRGTIIAGGGAGGVFLKDTSAGSIMISNSGSSRVYVAVQGSSTVGAVEVRAAAKLEELDLKGTGFSEVIVSEAGPADVVLSGNFDRVAVNGASSRVSILKGTTTLLEADGKEANIEIDKSVRIMTLNANKPARITGNCYIGTANIYSSYVYIEASPVKAFIAAGLIDVYCTVLAFSAGGSSGGGGGGGSSGGGSTTTYTVKSVDTIEAITVANGTVKEAIGLPDTVRVILNDGRRKTIAVDWDNGIPKYEPGKAGTYRFTGVLTLPKNVKNPKGLTASVNVTVKEAEAPDEITVTSVHTFSDINVAYGTGITVVQEVYLPDEAVVDLSDGTDLSVPVVDWDGGTPAYDGNSKGVYTFTGKLEMPSEDVTNPKGLTAGVRILVGDPVVEDEVITAIEALADISVAYGTDISEIDLPDTVGITLSNADDTKTAGVVWDKSGYDGNTAGTYTLYGTLKNLPSGVVNSNGLRASVSVIVAKVAVTSVDAIENIYVTNGTLLEAVSLPDTANITLNNGNTVECDVTWDGGTPAYDGNNAGTYAFSGTLSLPADVSETDLKASVNVIVADAIVTGVDAIADISVRNGTAIAGAGLPGITGISLSNGLSGIADIDWDTTGYDANTAGTYTLYGSLVDLPAGVVNSNGLKAEVRVSVGNATVASVAAIADISVDNGTAAGNIGLPATAAVTLGNGTTKDLAVTWDEGTPVYDGYTAGIYVFSGALAVPEGIDSTDLKASVNVIVKKAVVTSIELIADINIANGTEITEIGLPATVGVTLNNGFTPEYAVTWDGGIPVYDGNKAGTYIFSGTLTIPTGLAATDLKASVKVIVADAIVTGVDAIADINVTNGTAIEAVTLPGTIGISLSNGLTGTADIAWDTTAYDANTAETYTLYGNLVNLPDGVVNSGGMGAVVKVTVGNATVASVATIPDINVDNGTATSNIGLPSKANVTLGNGTGKELGVTWDEGVPVYDGYTAGTYIFSGTLDVPAGIDPTGLKASVKVIVRNAIVNSVEPIADINVANGTAITEIGLPAVASVTLNNGNKPEYGVAWDGGSPVYDRYKTGTYVFSGTLAIPSGVDATSLKAGVNVIVADAVVTGVDALATINAENGTSIDNILLPETVVISLNNGLAGTAGITWDTTGYDGYTTGIYTLYGTLKDLPSGVVNSDGLKACINIVVADAVITGVNAISDINVVNGTALGSFGLPTVATVTLNNGNSRELTVAWDDGTPAYDGNTAGTYVFSGTLTVPTGVAATDLKASVKVMVADAVIMGVNAMADINVSNGTAFGNIGLPATAKVNLNNGTTRDLAVTWDGGTPTYDGNTAGTYIFSGTLNIPTGIAATDLKASVNVIVADAIVTGVDVIADINVINGTAIEAVTLPGAVGINLSNGLPGTSDITWDTTGYNANMAGTYTLYGNLVNLPAGIVNSSDLKAEVKVIVGNATVASVAAIPDISVDNGTAVNNIGLPLTAAVTLGNGTAMDLAVVWDGGAPAYDGYTSGTYVFSGALTVPAGVEPTGLMASVNVIVRKSVVNSVASITDINVANGTVITAIGLPATVGVTLNNGFTPEYTVIWDGGTPAYDAYRTGTYVFSGTLVTPTEVEATNLKASVNVAVADAIVTAVDLLPDINVENGTAISTIPLPATVGINLNNGLAGTAGITWDTTGYDGYTTGIYTLYGTLKYLPSGVVNSDGLKACINIVVADAVITGVSAIADINVVNGTALGRIGLPAVAAVTLNNGTTKDIAVTWDGGTPAYDGNTAGTYVFSGTLTVPTGIAATDLKAGINVVVAVAGPTGTYAISTINVFSKGMSISVSNLSDANYFNVYRISNNALVNPKAVSVDSMITTLSAVYNDISDLEIWVYSDSAGSNRVAVFTLTGDGTSGTLVMK